MRASNIYLQVRKRCSPGRTARHRPESRFAGKEGESRRRYDKDTHCGTRRDGFRPAAAFDVIDLDPKKAATVATAVTSLNAALVHDAATKTARAAVREDLKAIDGMVRLPEGKTMHGVDRPAIALYDTFSQDGRLSSDRARCGAESTRCNRAP